MDANHSNAESLLFDVVGRQAAMTPKEFVSRAYAENRNVVYRYLVALGLRPSAAQDLTQEVFLKLYVAVGNSKRIQNARAWMFTVASHLALNHLRAENCQFSLSGDDVARWLESQAQPGVDPEKVILDRERAVRLQEAISSLSPQQRICLHLRAEGFRYREIAKTLGVSVPTVGEFLRRAISKLRRADI